MRSTAFILGLSILSAPLLIALPASARPTAQSTHCAALAKDHRLVGRQRTTFIRTCMRGPLAPARPTAAPGASQESRAVTRPSGVDRTTRTQQCDAEADRKGLAAKDRKAFQLSCLATAGPVSEGQTGVHTPQPAHQINGIGVNNYKPDATPATSAPAPKPKP